MAVLGLGEAVRVRHGVAAAITGLVREPRARDAASRERLAALGAPVLDDAAGGADSASKKSASAGAPRSGG